MNNKQLVYRVSVLASYFTFKYRSQRNVWEGKYPGEIMSYTPWVNLDGRPFHFYVIALGKLFTPVARSFTQPC